MEKIKLTDALKSTTMFLVDNEVEIAMEKQIVDTIKLYQQKMLGIGIKEGLAKFIRSNKESIYMIETLLGISGEKLKRVVSMIRLKQGYTFDSEWSEEKIQKELSQKTSMMDEFCDLFINGKNMESYQDFIPGFILQDFKIDADTLGRLSNEDFLRFLIKSRLIATYSAKYSHSYDKAIADVILPYTNSVGLSYFPTILQSVSSTVCYIITDNSRRIIINFSFLSTTSNSQNKYWKDHISPVYKESRNDDDTIVINILDGAGWIGRSNAYKSIYYDCDYFLNLNNLDKIKTIINEFFNI